MKRMGTRGRVALGAVIAAVAALIVAYFVVVRPWVAMPAASQEQIEASWQRVEHWARAGASFASIEALHAPAEVVSLHLNDLYQHGGIVARDALPSEVRVAIDALIAWSERDDREDDPSFCLDPGSPLALHLHYLGQVAIDSAPEDAGSPQLLAAARLAEVLRRRGPLLSSVVGTGHSKAIATWAHARGLHLPDEVAATFPAEEEILSILARESYCTVQFFDNEFEGATPVEGPVPMLSLFRPERELLVTRAWHADYLERAHAHAGDPDELLTFLADLAHEEAPRSLLLDLSRTPLDRRVAEWLEDVRSTRRAAAAANRAAEVRADERVIASGVDTTTHWRLVAGERAGARCVGIRILGELPETADAAEFSCFEDVPGQRELGFAEAQSPDGDRRFVIGVVGPAIARIEIEFADADRIRTRSVHRDGEVGYFVVPVPGGAALHAIAAIDDGGHTLAHGALE
jgi:hypothetical protein